MVADLIDNYTRRWKEDLIKNTFCKSDASRILSILLVRFSHEDYQ
ncbi:hypothetical protein Goari_003451, partial [Gossypium aridum]|nr:hypothetical protein [Gossypium aridum]